MKKAALILLPIGIITIALAFNNSSKIDIEIISFYHVPLECIAAPDIGCGSRIKPLFLDTDKISEIKESWVNRSGTVIGIIWDASMSNERERENIIQPLFKKHSIEASLVTDAVRVNELSEGLNGKEKWYKGMDVDQLSIEEAGRIAGSVVNYAKYKNLLSEEEADKIRKEVEEYFKKELVQVRTYDNLTSEETQGRWFNDLYNIVVKHTSEERADKIAELCWDNYMSSDGENSRKETCIHENKNEKCCTDE